MINMKCQINKFILFACGIMLSGGVIAADSSLEKLNYKQRIQRLERMLDSDVMHQQRQSIDALRQEISTLREQVEQQAYELESMKQRQRNLYLDIDRRINNIEAGSSNNRDFAVPVPPPGAGAATAPAVNAAADTDGQEAYSKAFSLLKEGQYKASIAAFEDFKKRYPNSKYADNAQYWLGEASYVSRDYRKALAEFQQLISQYPDSTKISGARLKIGYVYYELKNWSAAREALQQVVTLYPDASVANKANERLQRMTREGH
jgi:tol-pal system protein YbgF